MTFQEEQKRIDACYSGYYNDGLYVTRGFGRLKYFDEKFLNEQMITKNCDHVSDRKNDLRKMITKNALQVCGRP